MRSHKKPTHSLLGLALLLGAGAGSLVAGSPASAPQTPASQKSQSQDKPATDKPATDKPATDKPVQGKPAKDQAQSQPAKKPLSADQKKELIKILAAGGVTIDFKKAMVSVEARVGTRADYIEYLLIGPRGKKHEGLFVTAAKPSLIHAAMLALGYQKGVNARAVAKDPYPTEEEYNKGAETHDRFPPKGQEVFLTVQWKDEKSGKTLTYRVQDLYHDLVHGGTVKNAHYIYIGSRMARLYKGEEPQYMADVEQNLISNYYVMPNNQLVTVVHKHAWDDGIWFPAMERIPDKGHLVTFIFSRKPIAKPQPLTEPQSKKDEKPQGEGSPKKDEKKDNKDDAKDDDKKLPQESGC